MSADDGDQPAVQRAAHAVPGPPPGRRSGTPGGEAKPLTCSLALQAVEVGAPDPDGGDGDEQGE